MSIHNSDDSIERFSMGRLEGIELADFEKHLLQCHECQDGVRGMDFFLGSMRYAAGRIRQQEGPAPELAGLGRFKGKYHLVQAVLPKSKIQNIGILLLAGSDRLHALFRRDFEVFASERAVWLKQVTDDISEKAKLLGSEKCMEWLKASCSPLLQISPLKAVVIENYAARTLDQLYTKHIHPNVLQFRTHLPKYSVEAAAGKFGRQMAVEPEGWVEVRTPLPLTDDMFVVHVEGHSMEPRIPDSSLCAFRYKIAGSWDGKVLLIQQYGESGGNRYTVKLCHVSKNVDPNREGLERVTLESINPDYESWDVASSGKIRALGEFLFVVEPVAEAE